MKQMIRSTMLLALCAITSTSLAAQIPDSEYASRRAAVVSGLPSGVLLAFGARAPQEDYINFYQS
ncbi:MAG TPA: hypothetical protein VFX40_01135, partial [Gemmatimonadaceae bacterium]|nr:hypothetical protein [Gemmatimonadaceae bacterium]